MHRLHFAARWGALAVVLASSAQVLAQSTSSLSGFVFVDRNNDGLLAFSDSAHPELVIQGVTVDLFQGTSASGPAFRSVTTDSIGRYVFDNLAAGAYVIRQQQPIGYVDGIDMLGHLTNSTGGAPPAGSNVGTVGADQFNGIVLATGAIGNMYNFGERGLAPGFVSKRYLLGTAPPPTYPDPEDSEFGVDPTPVPEPTALALAAGFVALACRRGRARSRR